MTRLARSRTSRLAAWAIAICGAASVGAEPLPGQVPVPGTSVSITLPEGFTVAERFAGIRDAGREATVQVVELPAPVADMHDDMTVEALGGRGLEVHSRERIEAGIPNALLLDVLQPADGVNYRLFVLVAGSDDDSVLLTARAPEPMDADLAAALRDAISTASRSDGGAATPADSLSFTLEPAGGLTVAGVMPGSTALLTLTGRTSDMEPGEPFMMVARHERTQPVDDPAAFAVQRLRSTDGIETIDVQEERVFDIEGQPAVELVARAVGENGIESVVFQLTVLETGGYLLAQGHVAAGVSDEWLDAFRQTALSVRPRSR